jgi:hypothetical protein
LPSKPRPIKVANTAPSDTTRADEIAIKTKKTGKVTDVVTVMSILSKKRCKLRSIYISGMNSLLAKRQKVPHFLGMVQYYQDMWTRCSEMLAPLTDLVGECRETKTTKKTRILVVGSNSSTGV